VLIAGFPAGPWQTNCWVVAPGPGEQCVVIDPGADAVDVLDDLLAEHRLHPVAVLLTHGHIDHTFSVVPVCEASGMLLPGAPEGAELTCRFEVAPGRIAVTLSTPSVDRELPPRDTFAWTVLTALAGDVDAAVTDQGELAIRLVKHKGAT
jgi:glyoxylase-like metal-dependent hydrolase (beta-lactamase superfamily II)